MKLISVDQSLSSCALTYWIDGIPVDKEIISTVRAETKNKKKNSLVFSRVTSQIAYVSNSIVDRINSFEADAFVCEGVAAGSFGNQKGFLITLFQDINDAILENSILTKDKVFSYSPTTVKSFARGFLPIEEQKEMKTKKVKDKKTGIVTEVTKEYLCEMSKKRMVQACNLVAPKGWLDGYTLAAGRADYADSFWIGYKYLKEKTE